MIEGTQFGSLECNVMPAAFLGGFNPVVSIFDIPFLLPDDQAKSNELRTGAFGQYILADVLDPRPGRDRAVAERPQEPDLEQAARQSSRRSRARNSASWTSAS